ncbi:MAG: type II toxin-antitoxin system RelE/ParE family toxin [Balneolaceae bacterium]
MNISPKLQVKFFRSDSGREYVREWLLGLAKEDKKAIGEEIKLVQFGWPIGMPLVRKMESGMWEIRIALAKRIARIFFTVIDDSIILVHGFIKKTQKTPEKELKTARNRIKMIKEELR